MESKYLLGLVRGQPAVMWDKIQDFEETVSEDGQVIFKFKEDGIEYEYHGSPDRGYREIHHRAPDIQDYQYMGRRTALRHDLFNPQKRGSTNYTPRRTELSDDSDFEDDEFLRHIASGRRRHEDDDYEPVTIDGEDGISCGSGGYYRSEPSCGGEEIYRRNVCGGYSRIYGDGPCGAVMGNICGRSYGCGGGGHC